MFPRQHERYDTCSRVGRSRLAPLLFELVRDTPRGSEEGVDSVPETPWDTRDLADADALAERPLACDQP